MPAVAVYCSASERIDGAHVRLAAEVGALIAARGHSLVSGGGSVSMMGAVARAVREGGGRTYGVIPRALLAKEVGDRYADELVVTDGMRERKGLMDEAADAFVVLPGGLGTLEELLEVWSARALALHAKPVVVCDPTGVLAGLRRAVDDLVEQGLRAARGGRRRHVDDQRGPGPGRRGGAAGPGGPAPGGPGAGGPHAGGPGGRRLSRARPLRPLLPLRPPAARSSGSIAA